MQQTSQYTYPLLREFRYFYSEIVRLRQAAKGANLPETISAGSPRGRFKQALAAAVEPGEQGTATATATAVAPAVENDVALRVWQEVATYLDEKMFELKHAGNALFRDRFEELIYIMAAFADETFLCMVEWPGALYWREHLMELRYFRSQISGQMIFRRIEDLLKREDHGDDELCAIYLMVLSLGFKGSYARKTAAIDGYRGKLYDLLLLMDPDMRRESLYIFPEAYRHTVTEGAPVRLPEPRQWWLAIAGIVAVWLIASSIGWVVLTRSTRADLKMVNEALSHAQSSRTINMLSRKYEPLRFETNGMGFKLVLSPGMGMTSADRGTGSMLIAVYGRDGGSAGSEDEVRTSLLRGVVATPGLNPDLAGYTRAVLDVQRVSKAPDGLPIEQGTMLFAVDLPVPGSKSSSELELYFPQELMASGVNIGSIVAYKPVALGGEVQ